MPIYLDFEPCRLDGAATGRLFYDLMGALFEIHNEVGRLFDEKIYKRALAATLPAVRTEVPIDVVFGNFTKRYFLDVLIDGSAIVELKAVDALSDRHRSQLINYLYLADISHGKLVNVRPVRIEHEFVNAHARQGDRRRFAVSDSRWLDIPTPCGAIRQLVDELLHDWGVGLDVALYEQAVEFFCGGELRVVNPVEIYFAGQQIGTQNVKLIDPHTAFRLTSISEDGMTHFEQHARRFLHHTSLNALQWINIGRDTVTYITIRR